MRITCQAQQTMPCGPLAVFELMADPVRFPSMFTGYGLIPGIRAITLDTPLVVGATRRIHNTDGTTLTEHVTAVDVPAHHAYTLSGFRAPFSLLVTRGESDWSLAADTSETQVRWIYVFTLTNALIYPLAAVVLQFFMARAMQRCLDNMARLLATAATPAETL
ncbi:MAG: SRPBCC family protein [Lysobacter sp.]